MLENVREIGPRVSIRRAGTKDLPGMQRLELMCFDTEAFSKFQLRYLLGTRTAISLAADVDGYMAGFVIGIMNRNRFGTYGRIYTLDVDESYRGLGIGSQLTSALLEQLRLAGCEKCFLEVRVNNHSAIKLYERLGFEKKNMIFDYYAPGVHAIKMKKDLL
ncbi:MAG: putative N-acetyltransferase [Methanocella sp. PtaU1.Bin125]|nr:MAG: putative N-acetyltransferase [Methanocella sp. PtaU1.Bin125]